MTRDGRGTGQSIPEARSVVLLLCASSLQRLVHQSGHPLVTQLRRGHTGGHRVETAQSFDPAVLTAHCLDTKRPTSERTNDRSLCLCVTQRRTLRVHTVLLFTAADDNT